MSVKQRDPAVIETVATNSLRRSFAVKSRAAAKAAPADFEKLSHGLFTVRSKSNKGERHPVCLVWFGDDRTPIIVCACTGGTFYKNAQGNSVCTHAMVIAKRLIREVDEALPPQEV